MLLLKISKRYILMPVVLIVFFIAGFLVYIDIKDRTISEFNSEQLILARTASQGITSFFEDYKADLTFFSELKEIIDFGDEGKKLISDFYSTHKSIVAALTRVDEHGIIMYTYPYNNSVIGTDISYQEHVKEVIATHKPVISDVFMSAQGYMAIAMHVPIFKDDRYVGSLAMLIPIDELGKLYLGKIKIRGTGNVWLLSEGGTEIYCPVAGHTGKSFLELSHNDPSAQRLLNKIRTSESGTEKAVYIDPADYNAKETGSRYITFYRTQLRNTYWTILISYQEEDIYQSLTRLRNRLIVVFLLLLGIVGYYFLSLAKVRTLLKEEAKRKEAEEVLKESEEKFRKIFEDHSAVKLLIDPDTEEIIDANFAAADYYGWNRDELKHMKISQINMIEHEKLKTSMEHVKSQHKTQFEFRHRLKDGAVRDVEVFSSSIKIGKKELLHSIIHDITNRKQAEADLIKAKEKAEESDRLKTAFIQNMSHELRTPMNAIIGFSSLMVENYNNKPVLEQYSEIISQRCKDLLIIISDILDISRIESGQVTVNNQQCDVNELFSVLGTYFREQQNRLGKEHIEFSMNVMTDPGDLIFFTDTVRLRQIFINLISNSFKFTDKGRIEVGCRKDKNKNLLFFVSDTGIGIPPDKHDFVFERFTQLNMGPERISSGNGLGLSIVKGLVELLGGEIWFESEMNEGTTFYFTLPLKPGHTK
jgi:PAS domain S-box-containing protein